LSPYLWASSCCWALRRPSPREADGRTLLWLLGAAILYFGAITYAFAIDPKPRMFLPVAAAASTIFAVQAVSLWRAGSRALVGTIAAVAIIFSLSYAAAIPDLRGLEATASQWVRELGPTLAVDDASRRFLTLVPGVRALPVDPPGARRYMIVALGPCTDVARFRAGWQVERAFALATVSGEQASLCLFRRSEGPAAAPPR